MAAGPSAAEGHRGGKGFIGVWKYGDNGDIPPWAVLNATPTTKMPGPGIRMALIPEDGDLAIGGGGTGELIIYHIPELYQH